MLVMVNPVVVMGVCGSGKSGLASLLAARWNVPFIEGDDLHSKNNRARMAAGTPLTDEDREPWLDQIGATIASAQRTNGGAVATCSALKRVYRDRLRTAVGDQLRFVFLDIPRRVLEQRMAERKGHFMPAALLDSQLGTLERPVGEGDVLVVEGSVSMEESVRRVCQWQAR